jgi:hypothetical protein
MDSSFDPSGFDGVWILGPDSKVRDPSTGKWIPDVIGYEVAEVRHEGDLFHERARIDYDDDLSLWIELKCRYGAAEWAPAIVTRIDGDPNHDRLKPGPHNFRKVVARVGEPLNFIKQVYVDRRTHYRIFRRHDGNVQAVAMKQLTEDGQRIISPLYPAHPNTAAGYDAANLKEFVRTSDPPPDWP